MSAGVAVDFSGALAYLQEAKHKLRGGSQRAVQIMARECAGALASSTKVAPKTRAIVKRKPGTAERPGVFYAKRPLESGVRFLRIESETKADARTHKNAQIRRRGLAKTAWFSILRDVGGKSQSVKGASVAAGPLSWATSKNINALSPEIYIHNKLKYAQDAFRTKGRASVDSASSRALNRVKRIVERDLARAS